MALFLGAAANGRWVRDPGYRRNVRRVPKAMRITERQRQVIRDAAATSFGPDSRVRLFGSRLDDNKKGGDIDLLVECPLPVENAGLAAARMASKIQMRLGERKIDILYTWPGLELTLAHQTALNEGVEL
jgi:predicted nucleotidyltransferase